MAFEPSPPVHFCEGGEDAFPGDCQDEAIIPDAFVDNIVATLHECHANFCQRARKDTGDAAVDFAVARRVKKPSIKLRAACRLVDRVQRTVALGVIGRGSRGRELIVNGERDRHVLLRELERVCERGA